VTRTPYAHTDRTERTAEMVLEVLWRIRAHVKGDTPLPDGRSDGDPS